MFDEKSVMKYDATLPEGFDGVFRFTNYSDEDFVGKWGKKEYVYPAQSTSPMIIPEHSPLEIQQIRKKFAKDLAEREFFKSGKYEALRAIEGRRDEHTGMIVPTLNSSLHANTYSLDVLTPFIQRALEPLKVKNATIRHQQTVRLEEKMHRDEKSGDMVTAAIGDDKDLERLAKGTMEERVMGA